MRSSHDGTEGSSHQVAVMRFAVLGRAVPILPATIAVIALLSFSGWLFELPVLASWFPGLSTQTPFAASLLLVVVLAFAAADRGHPTVTRSFACSIAAIAGLSLMTNLTGIDEWFIAPTMDGRAGAENGIWRMASASALLFLGAAAALWWLAEPPLGWRVPLIAASIGLVTLCELLVLCLTAPTLGPGFVKGAPALPTLAAFLLLAAELRRRRPFDVQTFVRQQNWKPGINAWLLAIALCAALPMVVLGGIFLQRFVAAQKQAITIELEHRTEAAALTVARHVQSLKELALSLASHPDALAPDQRDFYAMAKAITAASKFDREVVLVSPTGKQLVNTRLPLNSPLPDYGNAAVIRETVASKSAQVSDLFLGIQAQRPLFDVTAPVMREGEVAAIVVVGGDTAELAALVQEERLPDQWIASVLDRKGVFLTRTHAPDAWIGKSASPRLLAARATGPRGGFAGITIDRVAVSSYFVNMPNSGWTMAIGVPTARLEAAADTSGRAMIAMFLGALALGAGLSAVVAQSMRRQIANVGDAAAALGRGEVPSIASSPVRELDDVAGALTAAHALIENRSAALRDSEARLTLFVQHAPAAIAMFNRDMRYLAASRQWQTFHGLKSAPIGALHYELSPDISDYWKAVHQRCLAGAVERSEGEPVAHADGREQWMKWEVRPWIDAQGVVGGVLMTCEDITHRKQQERLLRQREAELARAQKLGRVAGFEVDLRDPTLLSRRSIEYIEIHGLTPDQVRETHTAWLQRVHPDDRDTANERLQSALAARTPRYVGEYRIIRPRDGETRWLMATCEVDYDANGRPIRLFGAHADITDRKRAELALAANEAYMQSAFESSPDCVKIIDLEGRIERMNGNGRDLFELGDSTSVIGAPWVEQWPKEAQPRLEAALARASTGGIGHFSGSCPTAKGTPKWWDVMITPVMGARGRPERFVASSRDVTLIKHADDHRAYLMNEVNHRTKNLLALVMAVARQTAAKDSPAEFANRFSARLSGLSASHDLLVQSQWRGVDLAELVASQLSHFADLVGNRIQIAGPATQLSPSAAQAIGMALHELATNSGKHGALSAEGRVQVEWQSRDTDPDPTFTMRWTEYDGPPCAPPTKLGFGHTVTVVMVEHALGGAVSLTYPPSGIVWELRTTVARLSATAR